MEKVFNMEIRLVMSPEEIKTIASLENCKYKGFKGEDITDDNRNILHSFIAKGILFNSSTEGGDIALFLTPLGESILENLLEVMNYVKVRNESIKKLTELLPTIADETSIFNLNIYDYGFINQQLNAIKTCNEKLRNSKLIQLLNQAPEPCPEDGVEYSEEPYIPITTETRLMDGGGDCDDRGGPEPCLPEVNVRLTSRYVECRTRTIATGSDEPHQA